MLQISRCQHEVFFDSQHKGKFRIFPKGRRLGVTRGGAFAFCIWAAEGKHLLWGDTTHSNIKRYFERYFRPYLHYLKEKGIDHHWSAQEKMLKIGNGFVDFRSADRPENWEGFGYHVIFLNEAGIILNNEYLYYNAVLPMLMDFPDSTLIAAGTPKLLSGKGYLFADLWEKATNKVTGFYGKQYSTYSNPFLETKVIDDLAATIPAYERKQEIEGEFVSDGGALIQLSWFKRFTKQPRFDYIVQSWDTGNKAREVNDPSCCGTWGVKGRDYYLIDVYKEQIAYPVLTHKAKNLALARKPKVIIIEDKASGQSLIQTMRAETNYTIVGIEPVGDKISRMATASLPIEQGYVYLPLSAPWLTAYEQELTRFSAEYKGHKDQVDMTSQFINWAATSRMSGAVTSRQKRLF